LKGVAGNIGAIELQQKLVKLENHLGLESFDVCLDDCKRSFNELIKGLATLELLTARNSEPMGSESAIEVLAELRGKIAEHSHDAYKLLGNIKGLLARVEPKMLESLISSVTDYRFQEALEEVVELFAELERSSPASQ
tara:strand:+ start:238 stop:651 length:414 start_codon:yes stop_codon:yes gene_type:complete